jgi:hypothetical protein
MSLAVDPPVADSLKRREPSNPSGALRKGSLQNFSLSCSETSFSWQQSENFFLFPP